MASSQTSTNSLKQAIQKYRNKLAASELDRLLALALHKSVEYIYANPEKTISHSAQKAFGHLVARRQLDWSMAHLRGYQEFYGLKFSVNRHTLIPRPESELIVEQALKYINKDGLKILDIGTGSGCIILSIAKHNKYRARYWATDISKKAMSAARTNARHLGLKNKVKFIYSDLLKKVPQQKFDVVLANLPYLRADQIKDASIKKEPLSTLVGGSDGFDVYRRLFAKIDKYLAQQYLLLFEIDPEHTELLNEIVKEKLGSAHIEYIKDLHGDIRLVKISN